SFLYLFFNDPVVPIFYPLSLHDALPIFGPGYHGPVRHLVEPDPQRVALDDGLEAQLALRRARHAHGHPVLLDPALQRHVDAGPRSEEHTSELQSRENIVYRLLLDKKNI